MGEDKEGMTNKITQMFKTWGKNCFKEKRIQGVTFNVQQVAANTYKQVNKVIWYETFYYPYYN